MKKVPCKQIRCPKCYKCVTTIGCKDWETWKKEYDAWLESLQKNSTTQKSGLR